MYLGGAVCGDGKTEREVPTSKSTGRSERVESSWRGDGGPADIKKTKGQGHEHLRDTGVPVGNGNLGHDRTTTTKAESVRKQLGTKNSKGNEGRQEKNEGVKGRDRSAEELDRETGEAQTTVGRTRRKDGGWQTTEESGRVRWAGQEETREVRLRWGTVLREMWGRQERMKNGWRRQDTVEGGKDYQMRRWRSCGQEDGDDLSGTYLYGCSMTKYG